MWWRRGKNEKETFVSLSVDKKKPNQTKPKNPLFHQPSYLPATAISAGPSSAPASSTNATSALDCFKQCAVSPSCYGATFAPATGSCSLFAKTAAAPCPPLVLSAVAAGAASSALFPSRYSRVAEACISSGPLRKDGPPFEVPTAQEGLDATTGIAAEVVAAEVVQGATISKSASTSLAYLGSVARMVSPAVCSGICLRHKNGSDWTAEPTDFAAAPWAVAAGFVGVKKGRAASDCVAVSHYNAAAAYQQTDDRFEYVCDLWGAAVAVPVAAVPVAAAAAGSAGAGAAAAAAAAPLATLGLRPQQPGGRNSASVLLTKRWGAIPRA